MPSFVRSFAVRKIDRKKEGRKRRKNGGDERTKMLEHPPLVLCSLSHSMAFFGVEGMREGDEPKERGGEGKE